MRITNLIARMTLQCRACIHVELSVLTLVLEHCPMQSSRGHLKSLYESHWVVLEAPNPLTVI
eukprot:44142-Eustigmatos_ZCMA.PRE.1